MTLVELSYKILTPIDGLAELKAIESAARTCYRSENAISGDGESAKNLIRKLIASGHEAMLEHSFLSVRFVCDRGTTHELVRHRLCSFAQESTRYCNYSGKKFGRSIRFVLPSFLKECGQTNDERLKLWTDACARAEEAYFDLLDAGASPQEARDVLPNSTAAEIVMSANYREWRHILKLRTAKDAHPQMRNLMCPFGEKLRQSIPVIFDDCVTPLA